MTATVLLTGVLGGLALGAGAWLILRVLIARPGARARLHADRPKLWRLAGAVGGGVAAGALTGWPVAAVLAGAGVWWLPGLLGPDRAHAARVARIEAVASWTEQVRDLMAAASGLQHAIAATEPIAPEPIRDEVARLAAQLRGGRAPEAALADFAHAVATPTSDLVAAALASAAGRHAADLGTLLSSLAQAAREQAAMLVRVAAARARVRTAARIITTVTLALAVGLLLFNPVYLEPYGSAVGQLVLAFIGTLWAAAVVWLGRLARTDVGPRVLIPPASDREAVRVP
ncbi:type II secretion system F family protein [Streptomonospora sp. S1-112]|uniref:Type II secretion system F family protein n=1 Tax=Streptomonospora mangrovi TaxID=2883123 RepID=A0A9X3NK20_9ACTN|nr:type II secretion system F family protein [Streptomonospora mangrovi]MDA0565177.1 type II secretion system F family protein [Streptomonospora mangrovi]